MHQDRIKEEENQRANLRTEILSSVMSFFGDSFSSISLLPSNDQKSPLKLDLTITQPQPPLSPNNFKSQAHSRSFAVGINGCLPSDQQPSSVTVYTFSFEKKEEERENEDPTTKTYISDVFVSFPPGSLPLSLHLCFERDQESIDQAFCAPLSTFSSISPVSSSFAIPFQKSVRFVIRRGFEDLRSIPIGLSSSCNDPVLSDGDSIEIAFRVVELSLLPKNSLEFNFLRSEFVSDPPSRISSDHLKANSESCLNRSSRSLCFLLHSDQRL